METLSNETSLNMGYEADISESSSSGNHTNYETEFDNQGSETLSNDSAHYDADVSEISKTQSMVMTDGKSFSSLTENMENGRQISLACWFILAFIVLLLMLFILLGLFLYFGTEHAIWTFQRTNSTLFWSLTLWLL